MIGVFVRLFFLRTSRATFASRTFVRVQQWVCSVFVFGTVAGVVQNSRDWFPPDFTAPFLAGRQSYFFGLYSIAFYVHVLSGPVALLLGGFLLFKLPRNRWPRLHRNLGRVQVGLVVLLVVPAGLGMSLRALDGWPAGLGFATLAVLTAFATGQGYLSARRRQFQLHQTWMTRSFLLLSSAVILRMIASTATLLQWHPAWLYSVSAWISWLFPLAIYEMVRAQHRPGPVPSRHAD